MQLSLKDHVPAICIYRVTPLKGEKFLYERASTPWKTLTLKRRKRVEQEQDSAETSTDAWKIWKSTQSLKSEENMKIDTVDEQCEIGNWKQCTDTDGSKFEVDLRI